MPADRLLKNRLLKNRARTRMMASSNPAAAARYTPGSWLGVVRSGTVVLLRPDSAPALVDSLWELLAAGPEVHEVLDAVTSASGGSLARLPVVRDRGRPRLPPGVPARRDRPHRGPARRAGGTERPRCHHLDGTALRNGRRIQPDGPRRRSRRGIRRRASLRGPAAGRRRGPAAGPAGGLHRCCRTGRTPRRSRPRPRLQPLRPISLPPTPGVADRTPKQRWRTKSWRRPKPTSRPS